MMQFKKLLSVSRARFGASGSSAASSGRAKALSTAAAPAEPLVAYPLAVQGLHWAMGGSVLGCFAYVNLAQQTEDKKKKMDYMFIHKSFGTLAAMLLVSLA